MIICIVNYVIIISYVYYHGIIDHSGINFKRYWWQPWQPDCIFHDNHHQYFHVNFGFNIEFWDKLHGTYRRKDRIYREDIFYGFGKSLDEASANELQTDINERESENPKAYQGDKYEFDLDKNEISKKLKGSE
jgi:lathosterol oxidase